MKQLNLHLTADFDATPDEVFAALTDKDYIEAWSQSEGFVEHKIGGKLSYFDGEITGTVKSIDPGYSLAASWKPMHLQDFQSESEFFCDLLQDERRTKVSISHKGILNKKELKYYRQHWQEKFLKPLSRFFDHE